jgi:hypothetical protein
MRKQDVAMVRFLMTWNVKFGREAAFGGFIRKEFVPGLEKMGLTVTDFWSNIIGGGPAFLFGFAAEDLKSMQRILASTEWLALQGKLLEHIDLSEQKVVPLTHRFQL